MSIESLKGQARRHEQKEEWQKALDQYSQAIAQLVQDDQPDSGLYNRVGDLCVRVGNLDAAVEAYGQAADLYMEAFLPNNAIAVCKKIIRNVPERHQAYLRMGQIRAEQGFLPDARTNFLTYAERMQQAGEMEESFRALVEFCDLAPDETDMRVVVAEQMASHDQVSDAVEQLSIAYGHLMAKGDPGASVVEGKIRELDPSADLGAPAAAMAPPSGDISNADDLMGQFADVGGGDDDTAEAEAGVAVADVDLGGFDIDIGAEDAADEDAVELPTFDLGDDAEEEAGAELPTFDMGDDAEEEAGAELPMFDMGDDAEEKAGAELPTFVVDVDAEPAEADELVEAAIEEVAEEVAEEAAPAEEEALTLHAIRVQIASSPSDVGLRQRMVELAYGVADDAVLAEAFIGLAQALDGAGESASAQGAYQQVLQADPNNEVALAVLGSAPTAQPVREVAANEDYVDLGAMILGDEPEKTTRFTVAYEEPSGDEEADFANMLAQFKEKVSENLDAGDVRAHHDLGTAYKEMGLLDEAISEFQSALRASPDHLPTYEMLGQTFMEVGQPEAAVNSLTRALGVGHGIEDELIGIYYYLGLAQEQVGNNESAVEFFHKVFALDINFADVTERLRKLR
ncbi:MAG: tetratricopeptide repeat protein [Gemmatimonadales bacterium]|nr:tetratricopeptide repeat protein [Gemmatimonadales bacterium]MBT3959074.1 tetratricopeptide repeat protein [Gemmatimonadales bacterium]